MLAKAASYIPYSIVLLDSQGCAVSSVSTEEQAPQIGRLAADNRKQFRVRATRRGNALLVMKKVNIIKITWGVPKKKLKNIGGILWQ